jgi:hypothetical protein
MSDSEVVRGPCAAVALVPLQGPRRRAEERSRLLSASLSEVQAEVIHALKLPQAAAHRVDR